MRHHGLNYTGWSYHTEWSYHTGWSRWTGTRSAAISCTALLLIPLLIAGGCSDRQSTPPKSSQNVTEEKSNDVRLPPKQTKTRTQVLYAQHCNGCHGEKGDGKGLAARFLFPKPRDFRAGRFRLVSTKNGAPTLDDIQAVLARGMPGSAMPPFPNINKDDQKLLAEQVIEFRREGIRASERALAALDGEEVDKDELKDLVSHLTTPGPVIEVPTISASTPQAVERGKRLYLKTCAGCHGKDGKGDGQEKMVDAEGLPTRPRDLTKGIFKGSPDPVSVYRRTQAGMPGSPMPATQKVTHEQIADLVHFVLSLSDEAIRAKTVLNREKIVAKRTDKIPQSPADDAWKDATPVRIRMTPLWWRDDFQTHLEVQALHDGDKIAIRLSWADDSADTHAGKTEAFEDAVAVELYRGDAEPFLGMGAAKSQLDVWMWDADRQSGSPDVDVVNPNLVVDRYPFSENVVVTAEYNRPGTRSAAQPNLSLPARASGNQIVPPIANGTQSGSVAATSLETAGPGTVTFRPPVSQVVKALGEWKQGRWSVVMTRRLTLNAGEQGLSIKPGERLSAAFAVWDGSQRDRDGKKLITIWQDLVLE